MGGRLGAVRGEGLQEETFEGVNMLSISIMGTVLHTYRYVKMKLYILLV